MNLTKFIGVLCLFLICACKEEKVDYGTPLNTISFDFEKDKAEFDDLLNLIDSIQVFKLETNEDCLIGTVSKIMFDEDYLYVLDEGVSEALFKYTCSGKFVQKIGNKGRGPGEYIRPTDFFLLDNQLVLLDGYSAKVIFFSKTGDFVKEFSTNTMAEKFGKIDANHFAMFNLNEKSMFSLSNYNIIIIDDEGNTIKRLMKIPSYIKDEISLDMNKTTDYSEEELLYKDAFNSDIFRVYKDSFDIKYHFDFGKYSLDYHSFLKTNKRLSIGNLLATINKKGFVFGIDFFNENSKYLFFSCLRKGLFNIYYDKKTKKSYIFNYQSLPEWARFIYRPHIYSDEHFFVSLLNSPTIEEIKKKNLIQNISGSEVFSKLVPIIEQTEDSDNPILITYYFK